LVTAFRVRAAIAAASAAWVALLAAAPFAVTRVDPGALGVAVATAAYAVGRVVCHQIAARSFHAWGAALPVCARCTGIYLGAAAAALAALAGARDRQTVDRRLARLLLLAAVLPTIATLAYEWTTGTTPANGIRCAAGLPLGAAVAWLLQSAAADQVN
jgi:uncharacterized membrane protein